MLYLLMSLLNSTAVAGPWIKDPGHAYVKAGYSRFAADTYVDPDGQLVSGTTYVGNTSHVYAEVGLFKPIQLVVNAPFVSARNSVAEVDYVNRWGGDMDIGLAGGTKLGNVPVSLTVKAKLPLYDNGDLAEYGASAGRFPAMGDGQVDVDVMGEAGSGVGIGRFKGWTAGGVGYRHRTEAWMGDSTQPDRDYLDGIIWRAQLGWTPSISRGDDSRDLGWLSIDGSGINNFQSDLVTKQYIQVGVGGGVKVAKGLAVEAGYTQMVWAKASSLGSSVSAGLSWQR